jgi:hypothetical protein
MRTVTALVAICWLALAGPALAQFWPRNPYYGGGGWGAYPVGQVGTSRMVAAQNQQLGQVAAMGQNLVVQSGIRNTLTSQAQDRTDAIMNQRQANQNWWSQVQTQQMEQRQARGYGSPAALAAGLGADPAAGGFAPASPPPAAATDIIKWPSVLQGREFASYRAQIEAPYRRSPPGLSTPTPDDYRDMAKAVDDMKAVLEWRLGQDGLATQDYQQAKAFLNTLGQEVRGRLSADDK